VIGLALGDISAAHPAFRHLTPNGPILHIGAEFRHQFAFVGKSQESFGWSHLSPWGAASPPAINPKKTNETQSNSGYPQRLTGGIPKPKLIYYLRVRSGNRVNMNINVTAEATAENGAVPFEVERLGARLGAEIHGLDLKNGMDAATLRAFESALIEHKVVVLRDQHLATDQHVAISRLFGELEVHPMRPQGQYPEILVLDNDKDNPVLSTDVWHSDTTFRTNPTKYTILRCQIIPPVGGDTLWADMEAAYEGLSDVFKRMIEGLRAVHDFKNFRVLFGKSAEDQVKLRKMEELFPNPSHPVVRTHPINGRRSIYVNPQFTLRVEGMEEAESRTILDVLFAQAQVPEYQFRLRWTPGAIVFWDNRSTQHYAANDYYPARRRMERTAIVGEVPF
jgi:taurine dioxygenase